jgi:hypothetical protein
MSGQTERYLRWSGEERGSLLVERGVLLMRPVRSLVLSLGSVESLLMVKRYSSRLLAFETRENAIKERKNVP